ncbi:MAG: hypothetical protein EON55_16105 [Alphaproteobacteria bacterium]|nr:MAG: hypothetical protein EON55_16105 [Alphaproteobacteria bacterium]
MAIPGPNRANRLQWVEKDALLTDWDAYKRNMVRTTILMAHPVKGWVSRSTRPTGPPFTER